MSLDIARREAEEALKAMGLADCQFVSDLDSMENAAAIMASLDSRISDTMVIFGDWHEPQKRGIDVYDLTVKFVEDNFSRARSGLYSEWYAVIATERIHGND